MKPENARRRRSAKGAARVPGGRKSSGGAIQGSRSRQGAGEQRRAGAGQSLPVEIPPLLLEGDVPPLPAPSGPGQRYVLGPAPPAPAAAREEFGRREAALPEAYGTKRLVLQARDPHWLYACWDMTLAELRAYGRAARHRHLVLRVYREEVAGELATEVHVHPESRNWFVHVEGAGSRYVGELGYYARAGGWTSLSVSGAVWTPPDCASAVTAATFAVVPLHVPLAALARAANREAGTAGLPLLEAVRQLRAAGDPAVPEVRLTPLTPLTPEAQRARARLWPLPIQVRPVGESPGVPGWLLGAGPAGVSSAAAVPRVMGPAAGEAWASLGGPYGGGGPGRGFWFNVNVELLVYGATEPDARVTVGGRPIALRPDGSFSLRFAFPDGRHELQALAVAADGSDARMAEFRFERATAYQGAVGVDPRGLEASPPRKEPVA